MRLFVVLGMAIFSQPLWANDCLEVDRVMEEVLFNERILRESNAWVYSTVQTGKTQPGRHGGRRIELLNRNNFNPEVEFLRGNPDWNIGLFGKDATTYFGFEHRPPNTYLVPDSTELNGALDALEKAQFKSGLRFYEAEVDELEQVAEDVYLREFVENGRLPFVNQHDSNFHFAAIAIPEPWVKLKRDQIKAYLEWEKFATRNGLSVAEFELRDGIDVLTGTVNMLLNPKFPLPELTAYTPNKYGETALRQLNLGASPKDYLKKVVDTQGSRAVRKKLEEFLKEQETLDPSFAHDLFTRDQTLPPLKTSNPTKVGKAMNDIVKRRIQEISEKASLLFKQGTPPQ